MSTNQTRSADKLVDLLAEAGVKTAFTVPGESFLGVLDALYEHPDIRTVATRHEGAASFMAEATGKLSRRPGLCMATRGVGAMNLAIGVHTARQDSTPLIALLGQVSNTDRHREAFQEVELAEVFRPFVKWAAEPTHSDQLPEVIAKAASISMQGRPGPVVISIPEDIQELEYADTRPLSITKNPAVQAPQDIIEQVLARLRSARAPLIIVGGGLSAAGAGDVAAEFAEQEQIGVLAGWRRPDAFPNSHRCYLGHTGLRSTDRVKMIFAEADVVLTVGHRLDENSTVGYTLPSEDAFLIHVDIDMNGITSPRGTSLPVLSDAKLFFETLLTAAKSNPLSVDCRGKRAQHLSAERRAWENETTPTQGIAAKTYADQQSIAAYLRRLAPENAVYTSDAGTFAGWLERYIQFNRPGSFLGPTSGAMGYGLPAAIAAKIHDPTCVPITYVGDGGFLMTGAEIETAVRENAPVITLVFNNQRYATIGLHQEREYPGRPVATQLGSADFAGFAESLGARGFTVEHHDQFQDAFQEALRSEAPCVLDIKTDPQQTSVNNDIPKTS